MENFNLRWEYMHGNHSYDVFHVQCDDLHSSTIITRDPPCLLNWIDFVFQNRLRDTRLRVSMDMIWHQYFNDDRHNIPVTLQFCHVSRCLIYHVSPPENFPRSSLEHFLNHDSVDFVGFGMSRKVQYLRKAYNLAVKNWFDIPFVACCLNPKLNFRDNFNLPLQNMVLKVYSKWYPKPSDILQSNWRPLIRLSPDKVMYATLDCYFAYKMAVRHLIPRMLGKLEPENSKAC